MTAAASGPAGAVASVLEIEEAPSGFHRGADAPAPALETSPKAVANDRRIKAVMQGYTGDECGECANFTMVRNGTCLKCDTCGSTSGCS